MTSTIIKESNLILDISSRLDIDNIQSKPILDISSRLDIHNNKRV